MKNKSKMKKIGLFLTAVVLTGMISCNGGKSADALCEDKVAAAVQAACDSIRAAQPVKEKKTIVARVTVKKGKEKVFIEAAAKLVETTRQEEGNVSYHLYQSPEQPTAFIFYEEYKDDAAFDIHTSSEHFKAFGDAIKDILDGDLSIEEF